MTVCWILPWWSARDERVPNTPPPPQPVPSLSRELLILLACSKNFRNSKVGLSLARLLGVMEIFRTIGLFRLGMCKG